MDRFLYLVKTYRSDIIGIIRIFVAIYLDYKNCRKK